MYILVHKLDIVKNFLHAQNEDTLIVLGGTVLNALVGGLFFIFAPRLIGPENYGLFAVVTSTAILIVNFANLGIDSGILRFVGEGDSTKAHKILKLALEVYLAIGIVALAFGFLFSGQISEFFGKSELTGLFKIAFGAVIFFLLTNFFIATLQARKEFLKATSVGLLQNSLRLLLLGLAAYFYTVDLYVLTFLFFAVTIVSVITGALLTKMDFLYVQNHRSEFKGFFNYNMWLAASFAISSFPFDNYLLLKIAGPISTGLYAAPLKLFTITDQLAGNYSRVLAPTFAKSTKHEVAKAIKNSLWITVPAGFVLILLSNASAPLVNLLLGNEYKNSAPIFSIVAIASIFTFATAIPVSITMYFFKNSKITFYISAVVIIFWLSTNLILIPLYKEIGAAYAYLISEILAFLLFSFYVFKSLAREK